MAKTFSAWIATLGAVTGLGAGDKVPVVEGGTTKYVEGDDIGGGITALTGDVTASGTGSVAATIAAGAVTNTKVASGIDAAKIADGTVSNAEFQYLGGVTSDIQTQLNAKQASDQDLTDIAGLTPSNDDFLQRKAGAWANRTVSQVKTDLGVPTYARYVALLTQTGTDAPVATVLENTLGGTVVWTRDDVGVYYATLAGGFVESKTVVFVTPDAGFSTCDWIQAAREDNNKILFISSNIAAGVVNQEDSGPFCVEIRVYP